MSELKSERAQENVSAGWMVRASKAGRLAEDFFKHQCVALGWNSLGDLQDYADQAALREAYLTKYDNDKPAKTANAVALLYKFASQIRRDDWLVTYVPKQRCYLLGKDLGEYCHLPEEQWLGGYANIRRVEWLYQVPRDELPQASRNSLGATLTLFSLSAAVLEDLHNCRQPLSP